MARRIRSCEAIDGHAAARGRSVEWKLHGVATLMSADDLAIGADSVAASGESEERRSGGGARRLWWRLCLTPYGHSLLTPGASFWIFSARLAICIMATAEAISWAYLGYYIGESSQPYVVA